VIGNVQIFHNIARHNFPVAAPNRPRGSQPSIAPGLQRSTFALA
jgi:hypothetical protein